MQSDDQGKLTTLDQAAVQNVLDGITALARFLSEKPIQVDPGPEVLYTYLAQMRKIQRNTSIGMSLVACIMAKKYLDAHLTMKPFNATTKHASAPGLDIDECTISGGGGRVVAEIKTTVPCGANDLGAQQKATFEKDFKKRNRMRVKHRFFFVTDRDTFNLMRDKYAKRIPGVKIVLLPDGDTFWV